MLRIEKKLCDLDLSAPEADTTRAAQAVFRQVIAANWPAIAEMIAHDPKLMFVVVDTDELNDPRLPKGSTMCALDYVCMMRDRYTLNIFKSVLLPAHHEKYFEIILSYPIAAKVPSIFEIEAHVGFLVFKLMIDRWLRNDKENPVTIKDLQAYLLMEAHRLSQNDHLYSLMPFYWVCAAILALAKRQYAMDPLVSSSNLDEFWQKVHGFAMTTLLPNHMRKQFQAREKNQEWIYHWHPTNSFTEQDPPSDLRVLDLRHYSMGMNKVLVFIDTDSQEQYVCGEHYSLYRGPRSMSCTATRSLRDNLDPLFYTTHDLQTFLYLDFVRRSEFISEQKRARIEYRWKQRFAVLSAVINPAESPLGFFFNNGGRDFQQRLLEEADLGRKPTL